MTLTRVELDKAKFLVIPESEASFFFSLGHFCNEINTTSKLLYWSAKPEYADEADEHGHFVLCMFFTRLLAGHLNEAWEFLRKDYFSAADESTSPISKEYAPLLNAKVTAEMDILKRYFDSADNPCRKIRNAIAFHFSAVEIAGLLSRVQGKLVAYLDPEAAPNNLFHFSELFVSEALVQIMTSGGRHFSYDALYDELFRVAARFVRVSDGLMEVVVKKYNLQINNPPPKEVQLHNIQPFKSIEIPWFSDVNTLDRDTI